MPILVGISCCCHGWYGESSSLPLARQGAYAGKSSNDRDGWTQRALLSNELVLHKEEYDYKNLPITCKHQQTAAFLAFKCRQGCALMRTLTWQTPEVSLLYQRQGEAAAGIS